MERITRRALLCAGVLGSLALNSNAQSPEVATWPNKAVRIVVPYVPGGTADALGRAIAQHLQTVYKQPFVVDNRAGGAGTIGSAQVAKAVPDGYTLVLSGVGSHVIAPVDIKAFDPVADFTHIAMLGGPPTVLVVHPSLPAKTLAEFVAYARGLQGGLSWGSPGLGTHGDLIGSVFAHNAKYKQTRVGYKGANPAVTDLLGGQIPAAFVTYRTASAYIKAGKLNALAITSPARLPDMPSLPTFAELGYPSLTATTWFALSGPAGMAPALVTKINEEVRRGLKSDAMQKLYASEGIEPQDWNASTFTRYVQTEISRWTPLAKSTSKSAP